MPEPILDLSHVSVARGDSVVLKDISLRLHPGENLAILGPNGCGKSTLLKTITCELYPLVRPETHVRIFGRERWDLTQLRRRMGLVSAELPGKPMLTTAGLHAVVTGFFSSSTLWPNLEVTAAMKEAAAAALAEVDAVSLRDRLVGEMSAGQQRRVMIARALVGSRASAGDGGAAMLLLDEPSNGLDLAAQRQLRGLLRSLAAAGTTVLLITHHLPDIFPEIGRVLLMRDGRVVADGPRKEVLTDRALSDLFSTQVSVSEQDGFLHAW